VSVPEEGLTMTCQYCGSTAPVPDVEARRKRQDVATPDPQEGYFIQEADRSKASAPGAGLMRMLIWSVVFLVGVGGPLRLTGVLDHVTEPLWGDSGGAHYQKAVDRIRVSKYEQIRRARVEQFFYTVKKHYVTLDSGQCYALVLGSGQPFKRVILSDPKSAPKLSHETLRMHDTVVHCPVTNGAFSLTVTLDQPGRYTWALFRKPREEPQPDLDQLDRPVKVKKKRKSRRRKRRRKGQAAPPAGYAEPAGQAADPGAPPPEPARPPDTVDDDIDRAIKKSEIDPDDNL